MLRTAAKLQKMHRGGQDMKIITRKKQVEIAKQLAAEVGSHSLTRYSIPDTTVKTSTIIRSAKLM